MKKMLKASVIFSLITIFFSCQKYDHLPFPGNKCRITSYSISGETNYDSYFTYNTKGVVSGSETTAKFDFGGMEVIITNTYSYTRDHKGRITSIKNSYSDNMGTSIETPMTLDYDQWGGRIIRIVEYWDNAPYIIHNIKYNSDGLVSEYSSENVDPAYAQYDYSSTYEYNSLGQIIKKTHLDANKKITRYLLYKYSGKVYSNESFLIQQGLIPIDLYLSSPYNLIEGDAGSSFEVYQMDENDKPELTAVILTKSLTKNQQGFTQSREYKYTYTENCDCPAPLVPTVDSYQFDCSKGKNQ